MFTLKRGSVSEPGTASIGALLMPGFWPLPTADARRHSVPLPDKTTPVMLSLTRIFHSRIEQRSGEGVKRVDITQPNENTTHRFFCDRL
jgi:hypothetical protein